MLIQFISIAIAILALVISAVTLWLAHLHRGRLRMTRPTVIFLGPDGGHNEISKIFLRTLFYSTSKRGQVIENAFVRLRRGESVQNFSIWVYDGGKLVRGSGLYVGYEGIATSHHFLTPADVRNFEFQAGKYILDIFVKVVGRHDADQMTTIQLEIGESEALKLQKRSHGIYFDWGPDSQSYHAHVDSMPPRIDPLKMLQALSEKPVQEESEG